jgi:hypothetical protein
MVSLKADASVLCNLPQLLSNQVLQHNQRLSSVLPGAKATQHMHTWRVLLIAVGSCVGALLYSYRSAASSVLRLVASKATLLDDCRMSKRMTCTPESAAGATSV